MGKAIVVVDMLNDFVRPDGALPVPGAEGIVENIGYIVDAAHKNRIPVLYFNDAHDPDDKEFEKWPVHAVKGTYGAEVIPALAPKKSDVVVEKQDIHAATNPQANATLAALHTTDVYVAGVATEYCVRGAALGGVDKFGNAVEGLVDLGYRVHLVVDGISGVGEIVLKDGMIVPETNGAVERSLIEMGAAGVRPVYTAQVLEELVK